MCRVILCPHISRMSPHPLALTSVKPNLNLIISLNILMIMGLEIIVYLIDHCKGIWSPPKVLGDISFVNDDFCCQSIMILNCKYIIASLTLNCESLISCQHSELSNSRCPLLIKMYANLWPILDFFKLWRAGHDIVLYLNKFGEHVPNDKYVSKIVASALEASILNILA